MFYTELMTDMLHLLVYLVFFIIVFTHYGLPLHLVRIINAKHGALCFLICQLVTLSCARTYNQTRRFETSTPPSVTPERGFLAHQQKQAFELT